MCHARLLHISLDGDRNRFLRKLNRVVGLQCGTRITAGRQADCIDRGQIAAVAFDDDVLRIDAAVLQLPRRDLTRIGHTGLRRSDTLLNLRESTRERLTGRVGKYPTGTAGDENVLALCDELHVDGRLADVRCETFRDPGSQLRRRDVRRIDETGYGDGHVPRRVERSARSAEFGVVVNVDRNVIARMQSSCHRSARKQQRRSGQCCNGTISNEHKLLNLLDDNATLDLI